MFFKKSVFDKQQVAAFKKCVEDLHYSACLKLIEGGVEIMDVLMCFVPCVLGIPGVWSACELNEYGYGRYGSIKYTL